MNKNIVFTSIVIVLLVLAGVLVFGFFRDTEPQDTVTPPTNGNDTVEERTVNLYFYNEERDLEIGEGDIACSPDAVLPVERQITVTQIPIQDTIRLLLRGQITAAEQEDGFSTEFPGQGFELAGANLEDGLLTLEFNDPQNFSVGGSCRVTLLWAQIEQTALQFEEVDEVQFTPEELFQP